MGKISLEGIEFFANHGMYDQERESGNTFIIDISLTTDFHQAAQNDDIEGTIDYEEVYTLIKQEMDEPVKLLEHLAQKIINKLFLRLPNVEAIELSISKLNPPIGGKCTKAKITTQFERKDFIKSLTSRAFQK